MESEDARLSRGRAAVIPSQMVRSAWLRRLGSFMSQASFTPIGTVALTSTGSKPGGLIDSG